MRQPRAISRAAYISPESAQRFQDDTYFFLNAPHAIIYACIFISFRLN